jgi:hypothetical protein
VTFEQFNFKPIIFEFFVSISRSCLCFKMTIYSKSIELSGTKRPFSETEEKYWANWIYAYGQSKRPKVIYHGRIKFDSSNNKTVLNITITSSSEHKVVDVIDAIDDHFLRNNRAKGDYKHAKGTKPIVYPHAMLVGANPCQLQILFRR